VNIIQVRARTEPVNIVSQPQESDMAALIEVCANVAPQSWTASWAEVWYTDFSGISSAAWARSWRAVAYIPMMLFEHAEHEGVDVFGSAKPRGRE